MLNEGRSKGNPLPLWMLLVGIVWLAVIGAVVTVRALVEWLT